MQCLKIQPIGTVCSTPSCNGFSMAKYYCSICKFFDDERYMNLKLNYMRFLAFSWRRGKKKELIGMKNLSALGTLLQDCISLPVLQFMPSR